MTNLAASVIISLFTNSPPVTNFVPSGQMEVRYEVKRQYVWSCTNEGQVVTFTNKETAFDFSLFYRKQEGWVPASSRSPLYVSPPPLPLPK